MVTIGAADMYGLPVSTTQVLSSERSRHDGGESLWPAVGHPVRNLLMAWVLTLPIAILLSGSLYWLFSKLF